MSYFALGLPSVLEDTGLALFGIGLIAFLIVIGPLLVQLLWNSTLPKVCRFSEITFWEAFKLMLLGGLLSGGIVRCNLPMQNASTPAPQTHPAIYIGQPPYELKK